MLWIESTRINTTAYLFIIQMPLIQQMEQEGVLFYNHSSLEIVQIVDPYPSLAMFYYLVHFCLRLGKDVKLKVASAARYGGMRESLRIDRIDARAACRILLQPAVAMQHQHSCSPRCLPASGSHYQLHTTMLQLSASHHPPTTLRTSWTSIQYFIWGFFKINYPIRF